jgi:dienelactone hydrolase
MQQEALTYQADGLTMRGRLIFKPAPGPRPGVLVFPEAFGLNTNAIRRAVRLADIGYVALACDLHGEGRVINDLEESMAALQPLFDDPSHTRTRALGALQALSARAEVDRTRIAAMGFCFPMPIELARSGADIKAAVGFHTGLATKVPVALPGTIKARVLVCIGADDPFITVAQRAAFEGEMRASGADWQMDLYGGTVHSFTSEDAARRNMPDAIRYNPDAAARAWAAALSLLSRVFE